MVIKPKIRAFTIIEMVIVLAIISILASVAAVSFSNSSKNVQLQCAADRLIADLNLVRDQARRQQQDYELIFNVGARSYSAIGVPSHTGTEDIAVSLQAAPYYITSLSVPFTDNKIIFDAQGNPTESGSVTLSNGSRIINIAIDDRGNIEQV
ncbi:MAG: GspH/FimT family pseudopilin [Sedimentisphaerales bacterium]|nr:GspH/FimT family pseudopilin [Sedimentisphaerales bacterium]